MINFIYHFNYALFDASIICCFDLVHIHVGLSHSMYVFT